MAKFNVKDCVYVASDKDKTPMTIFHIYEPNGMPHFQNYYLYACVWLDVNKHKQENTFHENALEAC